MKIQLLKTRVKEVSLSADDAISEDDFTLTLSTGFTEEESRSFAVIFDIGILSEQGYSLNVSFVADFEADEVVTEEFKDSHFPVVNAPAIAYPFMRSFVSNLTLNSGYEPLILPTINFQAMANDGLNKG